MTTQITGRWETIIKLIKFENKAKEVLEKHLKDNKLSELPEPERKMILLWLTYICQHVP
jgi:hypothetical protein